MFQYNNWKMKVKNQNMIGTTTPASNKFRSPSAYTNQEIDATFGLPVFWVEAVLAAFLSLSCWD